MDLKTVGVAAQNRLSGLIVHLQNVFVLQDLGQTILEGAGSK